MFSSIVIKLNSKKKRVKILKYRIINLKKNLVFVVRNSKNKNKHNLLY